MPLRMNEVIETDNGYTAQGSDPYLVWRYDAGIASTILYPFNAGVICLAAVLAGMMYRRLGARAEEGELSLEVLAVFGFYFVFVLAGWLTRPLGNMLAYAHWALGWSMVLLFLVLAGRAVGRLSWRAAPCGAALSVIALAGASDAAYRLGATNGQPFVRVSHDAYQWRLLRSWNENLRHSSIRYDDEFREIRPLLKEGAYFISDRATSYYVAAALPLYPRITHAHHSRMVDKPDPKFLTALCARDGAAKAGRILEEVRQDIGRSVPIYVILVKDPGNRNVRVQCTSRDYDTVTANMDRLGDLLYSGRFVTVYQLAG
jgi:hypothetical protein